MIKPKCSRKGMDPGNKGIELKREHTAVRCRA